VIGDPQVDVAVPVLDLYERLEAGGARYRLIDHAPEGRTDLVSALRGHDVALAAKCLVVMVKVGKKQSRYDYTRLAAPRIAPIAAAL
jgi:Ala-tRNA(Pro) deacylase